MIMCFFFGSPYHVEHSEVSLHTMRSFTSHPQGLRKFATNDNYRKRLYIRPLTISKISSDLADLAD